MPKLVLVLLLFHWLAGQNRAISETADFLSFVGFSFFIIVMIIAVIIHYLSLLVMNQELQLD